MRRDLPLLDHSRRCARGCRPGYIKDSRSRVSSPGLDWAVATVFSAPGRRGSSGRRGTGRASVMAAMVLGRLAVQCESGRVVGALRPAPAGAYRTGACAREPQLCRWQGLCERNASIGRPGLHGMGSVRLRSNQWQDAPMTAGRSTPARGANRVRAQTAMGRDLALVGLVMFDMQEILRGGHHGQSLLGQRLSRGSR